MSHRAVRDFLKDKVLELGDNIKFGYGRSSDFNQIKDKKYPYVWCDPLVSTVNIDENFTETYSVNLFFYRYDEADSTEDQYKIILDTTDESVQSFLRLLNEQLTNEDSLSLVERYQARNVGLSNVTKEPVIKVMADVLTGWILRFNLTVPDQFDYCSIYDS